MQTIFHKLAKVLNGLHWFLGITALPQHATRREERSFVLMWLGIFVLLMLFAALTVYLLQS
jgi:hypothetical protein